MALAALKAEIEKKKRKLNDTEAAEPGRKYVKLGELEELRQQEYMQRQRDRDLKRKVRPAPLLFQYQIVALSFCSIWDCVSDTLGALEPRPSHRLLY